MKHLFRKAAGILVSAAMASSSFIPLALAEDPHYNDADFDTVFSDDFEGYEPDSTINGTDGDEPNSSWKQTESNAFFAVTDDDDEGNQVGRMVNNANSSGLYNTNRTPTYPVTEKTHIVSGRVKLSESNLTLKLGDTNTSQLLYFYAKADGNKNSQVIMSQNWVPIAKWVPDKWIGFELILEPNLSDLTQSKATVYLSSKDNGLTDTDGAAIEDASSELTVNLSTQAANDMFRFDSWQEMDRNVYIDDIRILQEKEKEAEPEPTFTIPDSLGTSFFDDFESYELDSPIRDKSEEGSALWAQTQDDSFIAAADPENGSNKVGKAIYTGTSDGLYNTNRTPAFSVSIGTHAVSGRIRMGSAESSTYFKLRLDKIDNLMYLYSNKPGNNNANVIMNHNWAWIAKWVPDKWIDFKLVITANEDDLANSTYVLYLSSTDGGLTDTNGQPITEVTKQDKINLTEQTSADMFRFDSWVTSDGDPIYFDDIKVEESKVLSLDPAKITIPEDFDLKCEPKPVLLPMGSDMPELNWTSSEDTVASVDADGNITPKQAGTAVITATAKDDDSLSASCTVMVTAARDENQKLNLSANERPDINVDEALTYPTEEETAKIALWKDNAKGAFSITTDDGILHENCFSTWINLGNKYDKKFTFFTPTKDAASDRFKTSFAPIYNAGMDVQSHSKSHYDRHAQKFLTTGQVIDEYLQPIEAIGAQSFAYPEGLQPYREEPNYDDPDDRGVPYDQKAYASKYYIAVRNTGGQINMPNKTGLLGEQLATDYMAISSQSVNETSATTTKTHPTWALEDMVKSLYRNDYIYKGRVNIGGWGVIHTHGIAGSTTSNPSYPGQSVTGADVVEDVLKYLDEAGDKLYYDTFTNVAKYAQERDSATLTVTSSTDEEIKYTLTDKMDDTLFNVPVTVIVKIPSTWTNVKATQNGARLDITVNSDGYALVETIPDCGEVTVAPSSTTLPDADTLSATTITKAFPGGKLKAVTMNFDDGQASYANEKWMTDLFRKYGLKATFSIPSGNFQTANINAADYKALYSGFEVAAHTAYHLPYSAYTPETFRSGIQADIDFAGNLTDSAIAGIAYPNGGSASGQQKQIMKELGIKYGRSTHSSKGFAVPDDLYNWNPTCFQNNIDEVEACANDFIALSPNEMSLFYLWGHGYQLKDDNKARTQAVYEKIANKPDTWYATNIEVAEYLTAVNSVITDITDDMLTSITNPSDMTVWVLADNTPVELRAGETKYVITAGGTSTSKSFTDPCDANPLNDDRLLYDIENGVGQGIIPDTYSGTNDTAYARYAMSEGRVHSLIYKVPENNYDFTAFKVVTYIHSSRAGTFHIYASPDNASYTEIAYTKTQLGDRNSWWLYRNDLENSAPIPAGTKYIKIAFPTDYEIGSGDTTNDAFVGNVELAYSKPAVSELIDENPSSVPSLSASYPAADSTGNELGKDIILVFDKAMNADSVKDEVSVSNAGISAVTPAADRKSFTVTLDAAPMPDTEYTISLGSGITDASGNALKPASISFRTKSILSGTITDTANDYRYVYEYGGSQDVFTGVDGTYNVAFARTAPDTADSTSYVVYRAPYGELKSFDIQLYRNEGACVNPFTVYTSPDNVTYTKAADDTDGVRSDMIAKGYYPIRLSGSSLPAGTKYIKIAFPEYSDKDANAHHMAQISDVILTYSSSGTDTSYAYVDIFDTAADQSITPTVSIGNITNGTALLNAKIVNLAPEYSNTDAVLVFAVYKDNGTTLSKLVTKDITVPAAGEAFYADQTIDFDNADNLSDYAVKCFIWNSVSGMTPLGNYQIVN